MSDIQRYILSLNPKLELADGCGKWCIYSEHIRDKAQAIEAKDKEIKNLKGQLGFKTLGIDKQAVIIEAKDKEIDKLKEQLGRGNPPSKPPSSTYGI